MLRAPLGLGLLATALFAHGCSSVSGDQLTTSTGETGDTTATTSSGSSGSATGGTENGALDIEPDHDVGLGESGCKQIDILVIVDNSNSMAVEQDRLIDAFAPLLAGFADVVPDVDLHVGVTKTDVFGFEDDPAADPDNPCAYALGGLLSRRTSQGENSGIAEDCDFSSGKNYMVGGPTLADEFACVARVGTEGNTGERQAQATIAAVSPRNLQAGACNQGFLRPSALLVVVVLTDEDDEWSEPTAEPADVAAQQWFDALVAAKGDDPSRITFVLLSGGSPAWPGCEAIDYMTMEGADPSPRLSTWAELFDHNVLGSICEPDYSQVMLGVAQTVAGACDELSP